MNKELLECLKLMVAANGGRGLDATEYDKVLKAIADAESPKPSPSSPAPSPSSTVQQCKCGHEERFHFTSASGDMNFCCAYPKCDCATGFISSAPIKEPSEAGTHEAIEVLRTAIKDQIDHTFDCGCTDTGFLHGCSHSRRDLVAAYEKAEALLPVRARNGVRWRKWGFVTNLFFLISTRVWDYQKRKMIACNNNSLIDCIVIIAMWLLLIAVVGCFVKALLSR